MSENKPMSPGRRAEIVRAIRGGYCSSTQAANLLSEVDRLTAQIEVMQHGYGRWVSAELSGQALPLIDLMMGAMDLKARWNREYHEAEPEQGWDKGLQAAESEKAIWAALYAALSQPPAPQDTRTPPPLYVLISACGRLVDASTSPLSDVAPGRYENGDELYLYTAQQRLTPQEKEGEQ